jgi:hypothetical protein
MVNVEKAKEFGKLTILLKQTETRISPLSTNEYAGAAIQRLEEEKYSPKEDFIAIVGSLSAVTVVLTAMVQRFGDIRCLFFHASQNRYVLRTLGRWVYPNKWEDEDE